MATLNFLGTGTSTGIPILGCQCEVCLSKNPKNNRMRQSVLITTDNGHQVLVDTTPDLRTQLLRNKTGNVDAAIITHDHADHLHGIDDLRPFTFNRETPLPVFCNEDCVETLEVRFPYIFQRDTYFTEDKPVIGGGIPRLDLFSVKEQDNLEITPGDHFHFRKMPHGYTTTLSVHYKDLLYLTDLKSIPDDCVDMWAGSDLDIMILDCVQLKPHKTHLNKDEAFEMINRIKPKRAILIHMNHRLSHEYLEAEAKKHFSGKDSPQVEPAYDTMQLTF